MAWQWPWKATTNSAPASWLIDWVRGDDTTSGVAVNVDSAMRLAAVWACVRVRSEDVGKLPCFLYQRAADGGKRRAVEHPLFDLIRSSPNPRMTAFEFRQLMQAQVDLRGNAYALKEFDARGRVISLWPLNPELVTVLLSEDGRELFYRVDGKNSRTLTSETVFHLRGNSLDGIVGLSPIAYHKETVGLAIAAQKYGASFFGNSAQPTGLLKVPSTITAEAAAVLRSSWEQQHKGSEKANRVAILDGGMAWEQTGMNNNDAQYLEMRKFQNSEIWRMYRMPAHKVGDLEKATFSNIEQQSLEYVTDCLMTELVRWEQTLKMSLLSEKEISQGYFFEFLPDALLRGDLKSRYDAYSIARNWGVLSVNDIRERENLNHIENGDIYLQPLNMIEAGTEPPPATTPAEPPLTEPSPKAAKAAIALLQEIVAREEVARPNGHINGATHEQ